jgi:rubrerythrin
VQQVGVQSDASVERPAEVAAAPLDESGFADFTAAGVRVSGEFRCADCGYGAIVRSALPPCPMCGGTVWESRGPLESRSGA